MPFTPFHLGPALLLGLVLFPVFDLPTLLIASVIPDLEPLIVVYFRFYGYPLHGFFHSYLGVSFLAFPVVLVVYLFRDVLNRISDFFRVHQKLSFKKVLFSSFFGVYSHVFLDSFLYREMMPFYPFSGNPFVDVLSPYGSYGVIYGFCSLAFLLGVITYCARIIWKLRTKRKSLEHAH